MSTYSELGQIRKRIGKLADEHRSASLEWIAGEVYSGIPEDRLPEIIRDLVASEIDLIVDRRGKPKGQTQEWYAERYELLRGRKKRSRVGVSVEYCPDGWYSTGGSRSRPSEGDPGCSTIPAVHVAGEPDYWWERGLDAWREFHETRPVLWKVEWDGPGGRVRSWYCDDELPEEYRHIANGEGHLDGYEVPAWRRDVGKGVAS